MPAIRHRVGIDAPINEVYDAVATSDGVARWWTRDVAYFLIGLKAGLEGGQATPWPEDQPVSSWG